MTLRELHICFIQVCVCVCDKEKESLIFFSVQLEVIGEF